MLFGLKKLRIEKHLTQQKLSYELNISREALSYYENGKREPSISTLIQMSDYFNVSIDYIIRGDNFIKK